MKEVNAYLIFDGSCRDAMNFYKKCFGGEVQLMTFGQTPPGQGPPIPPEAKDRVMHARLASGSFVLMASDNMPGMPFQQGNNYWISIHCDSGQEVDKFFTALSEKGKVTMPPGETFWAYRFTMFTDKFGVNWMLNYGKPMQ